MKKRSNNAVIFQGKTYETRRDCCNQFGISYEKVEKRASIHGVTFAEALGFYLAKKTIYRGIEYSDLKTCCKANGLKYKKVLQCIKEMEMSTEDALTYCIEGHKIPSKDKKIGNGFTYNGVVYPSFSACCRALNINIQNLHYVKKRQNLQSNEEAVSYYEKYRYDRNYGNCKSVSINGTAYQSHRECCKALNLSIDTINHLMRRHNITFEEAIEHYIQTSYKRRTNKISVTYNEITYPSLKACCQALNLSPDGVRDIKKRWQMATYEEAIEYSLALKEARKNNTLCHRYLKGITYNEITYPSVKACCQTLNLSTKAVYSIKKTRRTETYEEAIKYALIPKEDKKATLDHHGNCKSVMFNGVFYPSHKACCAALGIPYSQVCWQKTKNQCSFDEALRMLFERNE